MQSRKRSWTREEVLLALDLYLDEKLGTAASRRALSDVLRAWPIERYLADDPAFRGEQSVRNKLYNLQYLDTDGAQGREKGGSVTAAVWEQFGRDRAAVATAAAAVRKAFAEFPGEGTGVRDDIEYEADESGIVMRVHRHRERDRRLVTARRQHVLDETGALACEACAWDSDALYGLSGLVECHHLKPVSELVLGETTSVADLRLLCPNCHRLIHARRPWRSWDELLALVRS
jgi:5-methylcytosine-specific restriction protein A